MATGIRKKSKQNPRILYSLNLFKKILSVQFRTIGLQTWPEFFCWQNPTWSEEKRAEAKKKW